MDDYKLFAVRLKQLREEMNLTQKEFADKIGFTQATLSAYENNPKNPSLSIIINIAKECNDSIDWLCGLSEKKTNNEKPKTYSDLIKLLLNIEKNSNLIIADVQYDDIHFGQEGIEGLDIMGSTIIFKDDILKNFIKDWKKMKELVDNGTIDTDVYNLWVEKTLINSDISLKPSEKYDKQPEGFMNFPIAIEEDKPFD